MVQVENSLFGFAPIFIEVIFVIIIAIILISIMKNFIQWNKNNHSPMLNVLATVVAKRTEVRGGGETRTFSEYFVTFQVESGDRIELEAKESEFGFLVEGDKGELAFQGTRYLGFKRSK